MKCVLRSPKSGQSLGGWPAAAAAGTPLGMIPAPVSSGGFTLLEVVIAVTIVVLVFAGIIKAYVQTGQRLEWTGYSLAAQSLAVETIEQARATVWDPAQTPPVNEVTNLNLQGVQLTTSGSDFTLTGHCTNILDVPYESTNSVVATN